MILSDQKHLNSVLAITRFVQIMTKIKKKTTACSRIIHSVCAHQSSFLCVCLHGNKEMAVLRCRYPSAVRTVADILIALGDTKRRTLASLLVLLLLLSLPTTLYSSTIPLNPSHLLLISVWSVSLDQLSSSVQTHKRNWGNILETSHPSSFSYAKQHEASLRRRKLTFDHKSCCWF